MKSGWSVVMMLVAGCAAKTLSAGGTPTEAGVGAAEAGPTGGATFDAGTAGEAIDLEIVDVLAPSPPANGLCTYTDDPAEPALSSGSVDVASANLTDYAPVLLVESLEPVSPTEPSRIVLHSTTTKITGATGADVVSVLQQMCSGEATGTKDLAACATGQQLGKGLTVPSDPFTTSLGTTTTFSSTTAYTTSQVVLIDGSTIALLRAYFVNAIAMNGASAFTTTFNLLTSTVVQGATLDGSAIASNVYEFPVTVTFGGLVSNLRTDPSSAVGECLDTTMIPSTAQTCVPGQDAPAAAASLADPAIPACPIPDAG